MTLRPHAYDLHSNSSTKNPLKDILLHHKIPCLAGWLDKELRRRHEIDYIETVFKISKNDIRAAVHIMHNTVVIDILSESRRFQKLHQAIVDNEKIMADLFLAGSPINNRDQKLKSYFEKKGWTVD